MINKKEEKTPMETEVKNDNKYINNLSVESISKPIITSVTSVTSVTPITSVTSYLPVTVVTCYGDTLETLFGEETTERILKLMIKENKPLTTRFLASQLGKTELNIRQALFRKKHLFRRIGQKGQICHNLLSQVGIEEIEDRINAKKAEIEKKRQIEAEAKNTKNDTEESVQRIKNFTLSFPLERDGKTIKLDYDKLLKYSPELADSFLDEPSKFIENFKKTFETDYDIEIINLPNSLGLPIEQIRKEHLNKILLVEGRVTSFGEVKPMITKIKFECHSCGNIVTIPQNYRSDELITPKKCNCGRVGFRILEEEKVNSCFVQLEDLQEKTDNPHSQRIRAVIFNKLCESEKIKIFSPGNEVKCIGMLKEVPIKKFGKKSLVLNWIFEIISAELIDKEIGIGTLTEEEIRNIKELSNEIDEKGIDVLLSSFAPDVYGYDNIKGALALSLCNKRNNKIQMATRNKSNILLIGDPGVAKSVLCDFAVDVTHGARKAVGGGSSAVGITASVVKEEESLGGYRVEPGAMVLAKELLFIDELNNLPDEDKPRLQEGMSEQVISINKANLHVKMKVTGGVIASANPILGHFVIDAENPIEKQFNIPTPILNRFDSIFVIQDEVNENNDKMIAQKMIKRHRGTLINSYNKDFLRKFFIYIRNLEEPIIDDKTEELMQQTYYLARRFNNCRVKINPRFLEALTRMSIASAKIRQSKKIEFKDIERSIEILADTEYKVSPYILTKIKEEKEVDEILSSHSQPKSI